MWRTAVHANAQRMWGHCSPHVACLGLGVHDQQTGHCGFTHTLVGACKRCDRLRFQEPKQCCRRLADEALTSCQDREGPLRAPCRKLSHFLLLRPKNLRSLTWAWVAFQRAHWHASWKQLPSTFSLFSRTAPAPPRLGGQLPNFDRNAQDSESETIVNESPDDISDTSTVKTESASPNSRQQI